MSENDNAMAAPGGVMETPEAWSEICKATGYRGDPAPVIQLAKEILQLPRNPDRTSALRALREALLWAGQAGMQIPL